MWPFQNRTQFEYKSFGLRAQVHNRRQVLTLIRLGPTMGVAGAAYPKNQLGRHLAFWLKSDYYTVLVWGGHRHRDCD